MVLSHKCSVARTLVIGDVIACPWGRRSNAGRNVRYHVITLVFACAEQSRSDSFCVVVEECSSKQRQAELQSAFASRLWQVVAWYDWYDCSLSNT